MAKITCYSDLTFPHSLTWTAKKSASKHIEWELWLKLFHSEWGEWTNFYNGPNVFRLFSWFLMIFTFPPPAGAERYFFSVDSWFFLYVECKKWKCRYSASDHQQKPKRAITTMTTASSKCLPRRHGLILSIWTIGQQIKTCTNEIAINWTINDKQINMFLKKKTHS